MTIMHALGEVRLSQFIVFNTATHVVVQQLRLCTLRYGFSLSGSKRQTEEILLFR